MQMNKGMEMMIVSMIKAMGINPDEIMQRVIAFTEMVKNARDTIDSRFNSNDSNLEQIIANQKKIMEKLGIENDTNSGE